MLESVKISTITQTDFDKIITYLKEKGILIRESNRPERITVAEMTVESAEEMINAVDAEEFIFYEYI